MFQKHTEPHIKVIVIFQIYNIATFAIIQNILTET